MKLDDDFDDQVKSAWLEVCIHHSALIGCPQPPITHDDMKRLVRTALIQNNIRRNHNQKMAGVYDG